MARNVLSQKLRFDLWNLVKEKYQELGITDGEFAKYATSTLGDTINENHVWGARTGLEIPPTIPKGNPKLEARVARIEGALLALYAQLGWMPPKEK
jgi:hypothetical protein